MIAPQKRMRALQRAPQGDDGEDGGRRAAADLRHVLHREVVLEQRLHHHQVRSRSSPRRSRTPPAAPRAGRPRGGSARCTMPTTAAKAAHSRPDQHQAVAESRVHVSASLEAVLTGQCGTSPLACCTSHALLHHLLALVVLGRPVLVGVVHHQPVRLEDLDLVEGALHHHADALAEHLRAAPGRSSTVTVVARRADGVGHLEAELGVPAFHWMLPGATTPPRRMVGP